MHLTSQASSYTRLRYQVTSITVLSDTREKEDVQPTYINLCLESVKKLPATKYKYKNFTGTHIDKNVTNFIAGNMETIFPKTNFKG